MHRPALLVVVEQGQKNIFIQINADNEQHKKLFETDVPNLKKHLNALNLNNVSISVSTLKSMLNNFNSADSKNSPVYTNNQKGAVNILA